MVLGKLFLGCAGGQTFKERVCAQMCSAANERNFTLFPSASSSVFILLPAASEAFGIRCYNECWAITELVQPHAGAVAGDMASRR